MCRKTKTDVQSGTHPLSGACARASSTYVRGSNLERNQETKKPLVARVVGFQQDSFSEGKIPMCCSSSHWGREVEEGRLMIRRRLIDE